jgi:hypothetical protein
VKKKASSKNLPNPELFPQITFRLGYAKPEKERSPRRPIEEVIGRLNALSCKQND